MRSTATATPAAQDDTTELTLILPGERFGPVTQFSTEQDLTARFGAEHVRRDDLSVGEGNTEPGTVLFPGTDHEAEIFWIKAYRCPKSVRTGESAIRWSTRGGLKLGATSAQVEKENGGPFTFNGFDWDYGGYITDWNGGRMGNLYGRLDAPPNWNERISSDELTSISGMSDIRSDNPIVRKLQPILIELTMSWPDSAADAKCN